MSTLRLRGPNPRDRVDGKPKKNRVSLYWVNQISSRLIPAMMAINNKLILYPIPNSAPLFTIQLQYVILNHHVWIFDANYFWCSIINIKKNEKIK